MKTSSSTESPSRELALRRSPRLFRKYGLRKSPRLLGKSAITVLKRTAPRKPCKIPATGKSAITMPERLDEESVRTMPESPSLAKDPGKTYCPYGGIETIMRAGREHEAYHFKKMYKLKNDFPENKTCILPCGSSSWDEDSFGITFVAVWGVDITYVAFKKDLAPIKDRLGGYLAYNSKAISCNSLSTAIISEIEVRKGRPSESSQKIPYPCSVHDHERFAIVSVVPNTKNDKGENVDKEAAVDYLKGRMKNDAILYTREAEKTIIEALQLLYKEEFKAEDIWVHKVFFGTQKFLPPYIIEHRLNLIKTGSE